MFVEKCLKLFTIAKKIILKKILLQGLFLTLNPSARDCVGKNLKLRQRNFHLQSVFDMDNMRMNCCDLLAKQQKICKFDKTTTG